VGCARNIRGPGFVFSTVNPVREAEVGGAKTMLDRTAAQFDVTPSRLVADAS
jgi:hypothetical protein